MDSDTPSLVVFDTLQRLVFVRNVEFVNNDWMTTDAAAELLGVSRPTVIRWINQGSLPAWRVGKCFRITRAAVESCIVPAGRQ